MTETAAPLLLDVTRLVSREWSKRRSTGIDRVCDAYCRHFRSQALAVVQYRGLVRVLEAETSRKLFDRLLSPKTLTRSAITRLLASSLHRKVGKTTLNGATYINTSHTDFDLDVHHRWIRASQLKPVYFLHDLIPIRHPQLTTAHAVGRHLGRVKGALHNAAGLIVNARSTAQDLRTFAKQSRWPLPPVLVAPIVGSEVTNAPSCASQKQTRPSYPYFVAVGTIENRKNYGLLRDVWQSLIANLEDTCPRLIIVGQKGPHSEPILRLFSDTPGLSKFVQFVTNGSDADVANLVRGAKALLMPTLAEGYGLPVVEALGIGTPVLASNIESIREVGQGIPTLLDPTDPDAWRDAIMKFDDPGSIKETQQLKMRSFQTPTWNDHFSAVCSWLDHIKSTPASKQESSQEKCLTA